MSEIDDKNVRKYSEAEIEYHYRRAMELLRPRTKEEIEQSERELTERMKSQLRIRRRYPPGYFVTARPRRFFGIKIGWWY